MPASGPLLELRDHEAFDRPPWSDRVRSFTTRYEGLWELLVIGVVAAPAAVLIRPDACVAWVYDGTGRGWRDALTTWCGPAHLPRLAERAGPRPPTSNFASSESELACRARR